MIFLKSGEIDLRAMKMCSLKFGTTENKKIDNSGDDGCWMLDCFELCLVVAWVKHSLTSDLWLSNNILSLKKDVK